MDFSKYSLELHKPAIKTFERRRVISNYANEIWGADIVDFSDYNEFNNGYRYILCVIDVFSKFAWCEPLRDKTATTINKAFKDIMKFSKRKPKLLWTDKGAEFYNKVFDATLKAQDIKIYSTYGEHKSVVVERFNRTMKEWIWKHFSSTSNANWIDFLPTLLNFYNNEKKHRSIKMTPANASKKENHQTVYNNLYLKQYQKIANSDAVKPRFKIGNVVRISRVKDTFEKGFVDNWSKETFKISTVLTTIPITYQIVEMDNTPIEGSYYEKELLKTEAPNEFDIEKIVKTKTVKKQKQYLVKFIGWPDKYNRWLTEEEYQLLENK